MLLTNQKLLHSKFYYTSLNNSFHNHPSKQVSWSDYFIRPQRFCCHIMVWHCLRPQTEWFPCYPSSSGITDRSFWIL